MLQLHAAPPLDVEGLIPDEDLGTVEIPDTLSPLNDQDLQIFYSLLIQKHSLMILVFSIT